MSSQTHPELREILESKILPALGFQGLGVPAYADIQIMGYNPYDSGVAECNIDDHGELRVDYTGFGCQYSLIAWILDRQVARDFPAIAERSEGDKLIMRGDTAVEIPLSILVDDGWNSSGKFTQPTGKHHGYIRGWIGGSSSAKMRLARLTYQIPHDLGLTDGDTRSSDKDCGDFTLQVATLRDWALNLRAGKWRIQIQQSRQQCGPPPSWLYHVTLTRQDEAPFTMSNDEPILEALRSFLSVMVGAWCYPSTILCFPVNVSDIVERVAVGKLAQHDASNQNSEKVVTCRLWPRLFEQFWALWTHDDPEQQKHLSLSIHHYMASQNRNPESSDDVEQAYSDISAAKEAVSRWWNGFPTDYQHGKPNLRTKESLFKAVKNADLGKDDNAKIDMKALSALYSGKRSAMNLRNVIAHGSDRNIGWEHDDILKCLMHDQNLVRLLILAKLGYRGREDKIYRTGPAFLNRETC
jgi:hypothetical protein